MDTKQMETICKEQLKHRIFQKNTKDPELRIGLVRTEEIIIWVKNAQEEFQQEIKKIKQIIQKRSAEKHR